MIPPVKKKLKKEPRTGTRQKTRKDAGPKARTKTLNPKETSKGNPAKSPAKRRKGAASPRKTPKLRRKRKTRRGPRASRRILRQLRKLRRIRR